MIEIRPNRENNNKFSSWNDVERKVMFDYYPTIGRNVDALLPNKTYKEISEFVVAYGLKTTKKPRRGVRTAYVKWTAKKLKKFSKLYLSGKKVSDIAKEFGCTENTVYKTAGELGISRRKRIVLSDIQKLIIEEFYPYEGINVAKRLPGIDESRIISYCERHMIYKSKTAHIGNLTQEEYNVIKKYYGIFPVEKIAKIVGKTKRTVEKYIELIEKENLANAGNTWTKEDEGYLLTVCNSQPMSKDDWVEVSKTLKRTPTAIKKKYYKLAGTN